MDGQEAFTFGEAGLDLVQYRQDQIPEERIGYFTGYRYDFRIKNRMWVDRRDTPYILGHGVDLV